MASCLLLLFATLACSLPIPTLQVVVNPKLVRSSPIHGAVFSGLKNLKARHTRFVPWFPYPYLSVAQLHEGFSNPHKAVVPLNESGYLECPGTGRITSLSSVRFGNSRCSSKEAASILSRKCLSQTLCPLVAKESVLGKITGVQCGKEPFVLSVSLDCSWSSPGSDWNTTWLMELYDDFMAAQQGRNSTINFSTTPQWMWNTPGPVAIPKNWSVTDFGYEGGTSLRDPSGGELVAYYRRLVGELIERHPIDTWEVFNEPELEHHQTPQEYTARYDLLVSALHADHPGLKFAGPALAGHYEWEFYKYFLDSSNHVNHVSIIDYLTFHFYAFARNRTDPKSFEEFFNEADSFVDEIAHIRQIVSDSDYPRVKLFADEVGVILPGDNVLPAPPIVPLYWNAAGAMYAYLFARASLDVIGESQLVGYPSQFPSVTMLDWNTGAPNARYYILQLLIREFDAQADSWGPTPNFLFTDDVYIQEFSLPLGTAKKTILINKRSVTVHIPTPTWIHGAPLSFVAGGKPISSTTVGAAPQFEMPAFYVAVAGY